MSDIIDEEQGEAAPLPGFDGGLAYSLEEVVVILDLLGRRGIPGVSIDTLQGYSDEALQAAVAAASRALVAGEVVVPTEDGGWQVNAPHAAIFDVASGSSSVLAIEMLLGENADQVLFYIQRDLTVEHRPSDAIHAFTLLPTEVLPQHVVATLALVRRPLQDSEAVEIPRSDLDAPQESGDVMPAPLRQALQGEHRRISLQSVADEGRQDLGGIHWIDGGDHGLWMVEKQGEQSVRVEPVQAENVVQRMMGLLTASVEASGTAGE